uniref:peptide-methionine (S)-S-oxide reductase n=1 Tax=Petromyzon marinus TaxID=7757 RepID=A0AAJ7UHA1_PETMA|nr:mitochondrial peptide methionine sulfoxide reductase [Petromyzon marinus]
MLSTCPRLSRLWPLSLSLSLSLSRVLATMGDSSSRVAMVSPDRALPGSVERMAVSARHAVNGNPAVEPFPEGLQLATFGMGCFWGAERMLWTQSGVFSTQVGYSGGSTPNPSYKEVCSGGRAALLLAAPRAPPLRWPALRRPRRSRVFSPCSEIARTPLTARASGEVRYVGVARRVRVVLCERVGLWTCGTWWWGAVGEWLLRGATSMATCVQFPGRGLNLRRQISTGHRRALPSLYPFPGWEAGGGWWGSWIHSTLETARSKVRSEETHGDTVTRSKQEVNMKKTAP